MKRIPEHRDDRWISVEDRLPDNDDILVLVTVCGKPQGDITLLGAYHLASYSKKEGWILDGFEEWTDFTVTYWRELPPPPDGRKRFDRCNGLKETEENG